MKFNDTLILVVKHDLENGLVPALMGEPGIGKSSFTEALAEAMDTKCFVLPVNQLADKADLTGARLVPYEQADGTTSYKQVFFPHQVIMDAIDYAVANPREWPILFLDEINRTTPDVTSASLSMPTMRAIGSIKLPSNLRLMIAGNDKGNVTTLDEASLSRFAIYHVEPEASTLLSILGDEVNPWVKAVLVKRPELVFCKAKPNAFISDGGDDDDDDDTQATYVDLFDAGDEMLQLTTPRTIEGVSKWLNSMDQQVLSQLLATPTNVDGRDINILQEVLEGKVGNTEFTTLLIGEIATGLTSSAGGFVKAKGAPKPQVWAELKKIKTMSDLADKIDELTDHEKSGSLLYALYESNDNKRLIEALSPSLGAMEPDHMKELVRLATTGGLDKGNVEAFRNSNTTVAANLGIILDMVS